MDLFEKAMTFTRAEEAQAMDLYPYFTPIQEAQGNRIKVKGRPMIMVGSNNYLGLAHDPRVKEAARSAVDRYGVGTCGSRFLTGLAHRVLFFWHSVANRFLTLVSKGTRPCGPRGLQTTLRRLAHLPVWGLGRDRRPRRMRKAVSLGPYFPLRTNQGFLSAAATSRVGLLARSLKDQFEVSC